ncbi:uncharacterized protein LOC118205822 [Stegodyphus dumicola]|uniref:uncharacterized protein LOC118205822 n=1 Tax=Stegodyphus dumicola TaxID=202533 RepID=UPI0015AB2378|nr:uncharacterized protein LOC118205822 [Stegodyphus dumicola]
MHKEYTNLNNKVAPFSCTYCTKQFCTKNSLAKHRIRIHNIRRSNIKCGEDECRELFPTTGDLRSHLETCHNYSNMTKCIKLEFQKKQDFYSWLSDEERKTKTHFVVDSSGQKHKNYTRTLFCCNRSGTYKAKGKGERQLKAQGTSKTGFSCTATVILKDFGNRFEAVYFKEHYKHEKSLCHLPIPKQEKQSIAGKLLQGVEEKRILQDARFSSRDDIETKQLITRKDLHNIKRDFGLSINSKGLILTDDETSVWSWVNTMSQMEFNPVLMYKRQGEKYANVNENDFMLAIMTEFQKKMLIESVLILHMEFLLMDLNIACR